MSDSDLSEDKLRKRFDDPLIGNILINVHVRGSRNRRSVVVVGERDKQRILWQKHLPRGANEEEALLRVHEWLTGAGSSLVATNLDDKPIETDAIDWSKL